MLVLWGCVGRISADNLLPALPTWLSDMVIKHVPHLAQRFVIDNVQPNVTVVSALVLLECVRHHVQTDPLNPTTGNVLKLQPSSDNKDANYQGV